MTEIWPDQLEPPPNEWWATFDKALHEALEQGASPLEAEQSAMIAAEWAYPAGRHAF